MLPAVEKLVKNLKPRYDDDAIDRLNYAYTSAFFVLLIIVIAAKQYVGEPLQCWMSPEFKGNWEKYIENYCFVENTYYVNFENNRLPQVPLREQYELKYYQWVPFFLIAQLLLFLTPKTVWGAFSWKTGLNIRAIIGAFSHAERQKKILSKPKNSSDENSDIKQYATTFHSILNFNSKRGLKFFGIVPTPNYNWYFTLIYLFYKLLNCANSALQLYLMNRFLNTSYSLWGYGILEDLIYNRDWRSSGHFPRVTYCDFMRRDDASSRPMTFTVQCVLMINMFNEKLYIILWFWFVILTGLNILNLIYWMIITFAGVCSRTFIQEQLNFSGAQYEEKDIQDFIDKWLYKDGITALRLIEKNAGDLTSSDIIAQLYHDYKNPEIQQPQKRSEQEDILQKYLNKKPKNSLSNVIFSKNNNYQPLPSPSPPPPNAPMEDDNKQNAHLINFVETQSVD